MKDDLRFALRMFYTRRWFSATVILTLALGIGINTTVFTLVNAVLFKPLPIPNGERLVTILNQDLTNPNHLFGIAYPDYVELKAHAATFDAVEAWRPQQIALSDAANAPARLRAAIVSPGMFAMLHTLPVAGRGFVEADARVGADTAVLIGYRVWQTRYGGAPDVVGRAVRVEGRPATIVGVMPEGFQFPTTEDVWLPLVPTADMLTRTNRVLQLVGIVKADVTLDTARADLAVISQRLARTYPDTNRDASALVRTFRDTFTSGQVRQAFLTLLGAVACVLLIACANVGNLILSRGVARAREMSVRAALGATRWQIVRQLLVESVVLSCLGGLLGLAFSRLGVQAFDQATQGVNRPYWITFTMDGVAFGYFAALCVASGIAFGLVPALRASRVDLNTTLKDGTPAGSARGGKLTAGLVVVQITLTLVLLAGAGLMIRSFFAAAAVNPFVPRGRILMARFILPAARGARYADPSARRQFEDQLLPQLQALPGVTHAAIVSNPPGLGAYPRDIEIAGRAKPTRAPRASVVAASADYLPAIQLPILLGRGFQDTDGDAGHEAAIVTRKFAAQFWPGRSPIGQRFRFVANQRPGPWMTIVGVSGDLVEEITARTPPPPVVFIPYQAELWDTACVLLRTDGDPSATAAPLRATVKQLDPDLPLFDLQTLDSALAQDRWYIPVFGVLFGVFAATGLLIAAVGLYAVVAQSTARRTREIGIRIALGATAANIRRLVLRRGLAQLGVGLVCGLAGAVAVTRLMGGIGFFIQISPRDPLVFASIAALVTAIGLAACWLPARRAARIPPTEALRNE